MVEQDAGFEDRGFNDRNIFQEPNPHNTPFSHWPLVSPIVVSTTAAFSRNLTLTILEGFLY